ncbi:MAG: formate dehydrogenase accessory protein FdhE [Phycisphaerales bacterium]|nr:MAG: formate dehydrogenase accessory protein FdhE [Phycisphaerales bacterium]
MSSYASSNGKVAKDLKALERRAEAILKARPAYREMVDFYLTVFRRQIEWRGKLVVHPETVDKDQRRHCLREGKPLIACFDPGIQLASLLDLWMEMKAVFRRGNDVLREAVDEIDRAEKTGDFNPASWLPEQRPDRLELISDAARQIGVDESVLGTVTRSVTFPHWEQVALSWIAQDRLDEWKRFRCPACGGPPALAEIRTERSGAEGLTASPRRVMHCPFCGTGWAVPALKCPACDSTRSGDAKYYYTANEPELRIDFCRSCKHYVKVIDAGKIQGRLHIGLELLTTAHLDAIAQNKSLTPLEVSA